MKKILTLICAISMLFCLTHSIYAAVVEPMSPQWENTEDVTCSLVFNGLRGAHLHYRYDSTSDSKLKYVCQFNG